MYTTTTTTTTTWNHAWLELFSFFACMFACIHLSPRVTGCILTFTGMWLRFFFPAILKLPVTMWIFMKLCETMKVKFDETLWDFVLYETVWDFKKLYETLRDFLRHYVTIKLSVTLWNYETFYNFTKLYEMYITLE